MEEGANYVCIYTPGVILTIPVSLTDFSSGVL